MNTQDILVTKPGVRFEAWCRKHVDALLTIGLSLLLAVVFFQSIQIWVFTRELEDAQDRIIYLEQLNFGDRTPTPFIAPPESGA